MNLWDKRNQIALRKQKKKTENLNMKWVYLIPALKIAKQKNCNDNNSNGERTKKVDDLKNKQSMHHTQNVWITACDFWSEV